jgi:hypothetical protein
MQDQSENAMIACEIISEMSTSEEFPNRSEVFAFVLPFVCQADPRVSVRVSKTLETMISWDESGELIDCWPALFDLPKTELVADCLSQFIRKYHFCFGDYAEQVNEMCRSLDKEISLRILTDFTIWQQQEFLPELLQTFQANAEASIALLIEICHHFDVSGMIPEFRGLLEDDSVFLNCLTKAVNDDESIAEKIVPFQLADTNAIQASFEFLTAVLDSVQLEKQDPWIKLGIGIFDSIQEFGPSDIEAMRGFLLRMAGSHPQSLCSLLSDSHSSIHRVLTGLIQDETAAMEIHLIIESLGQ